MGAGFLLLSGVAGILMGLGYGLPSLEDWQAWRAATLLFLEQHPVLLLVAVALLPGLGVPTTPLVMACGAVGIPRHGVFPTCIATLAAIGIGMVWNYAIARFWLRDFFAGWLARRKDKLPDGDSDNFLLFALLLRITPGVPLALQNYFLGFFRFPFGKYLAVSLPAQAIHAPFYILSGGAIATGNWGGFAWIMLALLVLALGTTLVRRKLERRRSLP